jgi:hypothetical protein
MNYKQQPDLKIQNMKKAFILAAAAIVLAATGANAQDNKFWAGGSFGFSSTELSSVASSSSLSILPEVGYNFSDRWAVGLQFGLNQAEIENDITVNDFQTFSIAPFARYTFLRWKAFSVFANGGIAFSDLTGDTDFEDGVNEDAGLTTVGLFVNPGFSVRLSDRFSLTGSVNVFSAGYARSDLSPTNETKTWSANLNSPFNVDNFTLGFHVTF